MVLKKIFLLITFLTALIWFSVLGTKVTKAQTMEELSAQISALQTKIAAYQKELTELQARISVIQNEIIKLRTEMAELLRKQISLVQNQIAQLQAQLAKPESEWKCPDINRDGQVDMKDIGVVSGIVNVCSGQANYNAAADVDYDNCITKTDLDYVTKYFGKKMADIAQCKGVVITKPLAKPESECKCPDLDGSGQVDMKDIGLVSGAVNTCSGQANYNPIADIDGDNCITSADLDYVTKYFGKKAVEVNQCKVTPTLKVPESEAKCPDIDLNGQVDMKDIGLVSGAVNTCSGQAKYIASADVDSSGCIDEADLNYVTKYFGKKLGEINQCKGVVITNPTLWVTISAEPSSGMMPLNDVDLIANVGGTATGPVNYTFYCNRADTGTNITSNWCRKQDNVNLNSLTATDCCDFAITGTYTAKVIVERGSLQAEARTSIKVSSKPETEWKCPDIDNNGQVDMRDIGLVSGATNTCSGQANYNAAADVDYDNCITMSDVNYVTKYFGKKAGDISQCAR